MPMGGEVYWLTLDANDRIDLHPDDGREIREDYAALFGAAHQLVQAARDARLLDEPATVMVRHLDGPLAFRAKVAV